MKTSTIIVALMIEVLALPLRAAELPFPSYLEDKSTISPPFLDTDKVPLVREGQTYGIPGDQITTIDNDQALVNKTIDCALNTCIGVVPNVPDTAALASADTTRYPNGVLRTDYAAGNGAPPLFFKPQAGTCTTNSMVNDGGSCINNASGGSWKAIYAGPIRDVRQYGAHCDNTNDDHLPIQAAIKSVGVAGGGGVFIPAGTCYTGTTTLNVGDGSSAAWSTYQGVSLVGISGANAIIGTFGAPDRAISRIRYTGTGAAIKIAGPTHGWGMQGIQIRCGNAVGSIGLSVVSGMFGDIRDLSIDDCRTGIKEDAVSAKPTGVTVINSMHNKFENIQITHTLIAGATVEGIVETGNSLGNSCFNHFVNVSVVGKAAVSGATIYGMRLAATDSDVIDGLHLYGIRNGVAGVTAAIVTFDYLNPGNSGWPAGTHLSSIEAADSPPINLGTPAASAAANHWTSIKYTNGGDAPILSNLITDFVKGMWTPVLRGSTTAGSVTYGTFGQLGDYEISGYFVRVSFHISIASIIGATGAIQTVNLPIPVDAQATSVRGGCTIVNATFVTYDPGISVLSAQVSSVDNSITFTELGSAQTAPQFLAPSQLGAGATIDGSCSYRRKQIY